MYRSDVWSAPNSWKTRNQRHGFTVGCTDRNVGPDLPLGYCSTGLLCAVSDGQFQRQYIPHARRRSRLVTARLRQCCVDLPAYLYNRLQSVLNAAARSIAGLRRSDHITDTLASFHWLKIPERIQLSWRQSSIVHWLLATWLQICAVCLICRPDNV